MKVRERVQRRQLLAQLLQILVDLLEVLKSILILALLGSGALHLSCEWGIVKIMILVKGTFL